MVTPRRKRVRYKLAAAELCRVHGREIDLDRWEQVWALLDEFDEQTCVYAICDEKNGLVKFGKSVNPGSRLKAIKTGNGNDLKLRAFCKETPEINERLIHAEVGCHRVSGEWFRLNRYTRVWIQTIKEWSEYKLEPEYQAHIDSIHKGSTKDAAC